MQNQVVTKALANADAMKYYMIGVMDMTISKNGFSGNQWRLIEYGHLLGSKYALDILMLLHSNPYKRCDIAKLICGSSKRGRESSRCNFYLKRLLNAGLIQKQKSIHDQTIDIVGGYSITEQGKEIYQIALKCANEIVLLKDKKNLTHKVLNI